jgi:hypothetical protein
VSDQGVMCGECVIRRLGKISELCYVRCDK